MRRTMCGVVAVITAVVMLTGCTGSAGQSGADDKTINYWGYEGGISTETAKQVIADFEDAHPGYTVNAVVMDTADFDVKLPSTLGKASGPDLVYTGTEPNHLGRYVNVGQVSALDDVWEENGWDDLVPSTQQRLTYGGTPYAVGNELETVGLMYNKVILDRLGIAVPKTLKDLEAAMDTVRASGDGTTPMVLACGGPCYAGLHMMHALGYATIPTNTIVATTSDGDGAYTDGGWLEMLQKFQEWNDAGYFTADASGIPDENHTADFCSGGTAFMVKGPWMFNAMAECEKANPDAFTFGFTGFPVAEGMPFQAYVGTGKAWFLSSSLDGKEEKRQAVLDLVKGFTDASTFPSWIEKDQRFPAMAFDPADYSMTGPQQEAMQIIQDAGDNGGPVDIGFNNSAEETQVWVSGLQGILGGTATPQEVVDQLQAQLEKDQAAWAEVK
ncbi:MULTISPECIES: ABC transporter substrate-binding protein [unclassified Microbacterium]|uniref:ABC transporter substrate-binding protein n=1 Tax=unclassified Microbacterium TaxID=2609290 RepID=UPI0010F6BCA1|nr:MULTISPECIES: ABC transporter substrate-binding protein [unclassified Microbacterium]